MNYLAHAYLSFAQVDILVGNMISDFVKGKKQFEYSAGVQKGISLHRAIDAFTDTHPITLSAKKIFKPAYGLYSGVFMDIVYDHFLANDKNEFPDAADLKRFSQNTYAQLQLESKAFPEKFQLVFQYMQGQDWLYHYQFKQQIYSSFKGLVRRAKFMHQYEPACSALDDHYLELNSYYAGFFPELKHFAFGKWKELSEKP